MTDTTAEIRDRLLDAALPHVPFEGWSEACFDAAVSDAGLDPAAARSACPRGAIDLAAAQHRRSDAQMVAEIEKADMASLKFREKVAAALRIRVQALGDRETVRRATALFALPQHSFEGGRLIWETADHVWIALGDTSDDVNWYTKRATLSAVWGATVLFWLGDDSPGAERTSAFIDRRIEDVMQIEKLKANLRESPISKPIMSLQSALFSNLRAPSRAPRDDLPGRWEPDSN